MVETDNNIDEALQTFEALFHASQGTSTAAWLQVDLTMAQLKALFALAQERNTTIGHVGVMLGIGTSAASQLIERLVQQGLVARQEDLKDRRRTLVCVTAEGEHLVSRLRQGSRDRLQEWVSQLNSADLDALIQGIRALAAAASSTSASSGLQAAGTQRLSDQAV